ncbi:hypothetical protein M0Q97_10815 [Candidatus Dojkabacteria bacterium]|jgi:hypothetical protein|nr:hypothetical protein [Candidatus Dojkabacteria bacterium]
MNDYDLVLYYCKNSKTSEPNFEAIKKENPNKSIDEILDIYNSLKKKYLENSQGNLIIDTFVVVPDDDNFMNVIKEIEKNNFIAWNENSLKVINSKR